MNQDFKLDNYHSVVENIKEQVLYLPTAIRNKWVDEILEVLELDDIRDQKAHTLSGGEKQRLAIGRAIAKEPKLLLLDEPFSHLDGRMRSKLIRYLGELKSIRKMAIILVSHDGTELLGLSDKVYHLKNGQAIRKDHSPYHGHNFRRNLIVYKNDIYLLGGYGFFETNNNLEKFSFKTKY